MEKLTRRRVNASMLPHFVGKNVCVLGTVKNVEGNGFTLTASDGKDVRVITNHPVGYVSGITEVTGEVDGQNRIMCENYMSLAQELVESFDMDLYNSAIELTERLPQHYITGVTG